jgi:hypothetical protein
MHISSAAPVLADGDLAVLVPVVGGGVALLVLLALRSSAAVRTVVLGCAAGATFGTTAALVRLLADRIASDGAGGLVGWATPVVVATAVVGLLLEQAAYKSGRLGVAVAGCIVIDPLVAVGVGALALHQPARFAHPFLAVAEALVVVAGVVLLASKTAAPTPRTDPHRVARLDRCPHVPQLRLPTSARAHSDWFFGNGPPA